MSRRTMVVFPAPDGPETTRSVEGLGLLNVLNLLAHLLDLDLDPDDRLRDLRVRRLRAHRVRLAEHLLHEEVELATDVARRLSQDDGELSGVAPEPRDLFGDVAPVGH